MIGLERLQDKSIYFWLVDLFSSYPIVTVNDGYPNTDLQIPSVTIEAGTLSGKEFEHGNRRSARERVWNIDVIALNKEQRDEFVSYILNNLENGIPVYDYNDGFPPTVVDQIGTIRAENFIVTPIRIFPDLVEKLYWRSTIKFFDKYLP